MFVRGNMTFPVYIIFFEFQYEFQICLSVMNYNSKFKEKRDLDINRSTLI